MTPRKKRIAIVSFVMLGMGLAVALILTAFEKNLLYFYSPTQITEGEAPDARAFRVGGIVVDGSVKRDPESLDVEFVLTDTLNQIKVNYEGILPDLFREGQGIVANGRLDNDGVFQAREVLAKHDENYMPPEIADAIEKAGGEITYPVHETGNQ